MQPRYLRQQDTYSCGPHMLLNALKWAGVRATSETHLGRLIRSCRTKQGSPYKGTHFSGMMYGILSQKKHIHIEKIIFKPTLKQLDKWLKSGDYCIGLSYSYEENDDLFGHYTLIVGKTARTFTLVNDVKYQSTTIRRSRRTISEYLKGVPGVSHSKAFIIGRGPEPAKKCTCHSTEN